jgi:hypothetical protein
MEVMAFVKMGLVIEGGGAPRRRDDGRRRPNASLLQGG